MNENNNQNASMEMNPFAAGPATTPASPVAPAPVTSPTPVSPVPQAPVQPQMSVPQVPVQQPIPQQVSPAPVAAPVPASPMPQAQQVAQAPVAPVPQAPAVSQPLPTTPVTQVAPNPMAASREEMAVPQTMAMPQKQVIIRPVATSIADINAGLSGAKVDNTPVQQSVVNDEGEGDAKDVTFDYNALYGIESKDITDVQPQQPENKPLYTTQDIVLDNSNNGSGFVPSFNAGDLDSNASGSNNLTDDVLSDKQMDKADTRKKIIFIGAIVVIIILCLKFIFPLIAGYNM